MTRIKVYYILGYNTHMFRPTLWRPRNKTSRTLSQDTSQPTCIFLNTELRSKTCKKNMPNILNTCHSDTTSSRRQAAVCLHYGIWKSASLEMWA